MTIAAVNSSLAIVKPTNPKPQFGDLLKWLQAQLDENTPCERGAYMLIHGMHDIETTESLQNYAVKAHEYNLALYDAIAALTKLQSVGFPKKPKLLTSKASAKQIEQNIKEVNATKSQMIVNLQAVQGILEIED